MATHRAASGLILDAKNAVLILRRGDTHPWAAHEPDLPGGFVEDGETHSSGLAREILEEVGLNISESYLKEAGIFTHHDYSNNNEIEHSLYAFRCHIRPEIILSWEHDKYDWIPINKVKGLEKPLQNKIDTLLSEGFFETL
jgi:8-oxo-dGTP pyrophosphatase MutT (NUDIX family)